MLLLGHLVIDLLEPPLIGIRCHHVHKSLIILMELPRFLRDHDDIFLILSHHGTCSDISIVVIGATAISQHHQSLASQTMPSYSWLRVVGGWLVMR